MATQGTASAPAPQGTAGPLASPPSIGSGTAEYDPKTDPKRKAKSGDPGWKYGFWPELGNRDLVECILCGTQVNAGIKRLKEHLVGGYGDAIKCSKTTTAIAAEMEEALQKGRRKRALNLDDDDDGVQVVEVGPSENNANASSQSTSTTVVQRPSSGTASKKRQSALKFASLPPRPKEKSVITMLRKKPEEVVEERHSKNGPAQSSVESRIRTKEERDEVSMHVANFFYECGIPFNAIKSRSFEIMCEAIGQYGHGYKPPSFHEVKVPLLAKAVEQTNKLKEKHEAAWKQYGCTLMSDGWTDKQGRHLINFLVNSPEGTFFLESVDASSQVHDAPMLADLLQQRIDLIGRDKVVQVVTDNGANYKAACKLLMERIPTLFWTPCAAHCLDLMLEDIGKIKQFSKPIARARQVTTFIYRHWRLLDAMREKTGGRDLVRPGVTRFATAFLTLRSLHTHKDALKFLFVSDDWTKSKLATTEAGKKVHDTILSTEFWNSVEDCLRASQPLIILLRIVDGDERPAMPEVQFCMEHAKKKIKDNFPTARKADLLKKILAIIDRRWEDQMDQPLYGAALYLNPNKYFDLKTDDVLAGQLRSAFTEVLAKMVPDQDLQNKIDQQALEYEDLRGSFSNKIAVNNIKTKSPIEWWRSYGGKAVELQRFAKRIVGLCAASSGCERCWSTFEFIHTKKRNRLEHKRLNDLVYVQYNRRMAVRFQKRHEKGAGSFDPLCLEDFDWNNEWVDVDAEPVHNGRGLEITWEQVDEAVGASQMYRGRNFPRAAHGDATNIDRTYTRRRSAAATAPIRRIDELQEAEDMEDENSDEDYLVDDVEVDDYGEIAPIVDHESDEEAVDGGNSDPFMMDDDFY